MTGAATRAVTIITGASEGIGHELARCFAAGGRDLLLIARSSGRLTRAAKKISSQYGVTATPLALDVTDKNAPAAIDAALANENAYADVLVNSAGMGLSGEFWSHGEDDIERLLQLNVTALTRLMRHFLPAMIERNAGGILNVASLGGYVPGPCQAAYYASKAYVISLSEAVAVEAGSHGVMICALAPGPFPSRFHEHMGSENDLYYRWLPVMSAARAARSGYRGFLWRRRVVVPGVMNNILALALRVTPHAITNPILALLLRRRPQGNNNVRQ